MDDGYKGSVILVSPWTLFFCKYIFSSETCLSFIEADFDG